MRRYLGVLIALLAGSAEAQEKSQLYLRAVNNASHEMIECQAYYAINEVCIRNRNDHRDAAVLKQTSDVRRRLFERVIDLSKEAGIKPETVIVRTKIANADMMKEIDNNCGNVPFYSLNIRILQKYR